MFKKKFSGDTKKIKSVLIITFVFLLASSLTACSNLLISFTTTEHQEIHQDKTPIGTVTVSILFPEESGIENTDGKASLYESDSSVLGALKDYCEINGIDLAIETGTTTYVTGIGGVSENDYGDISGWVYTVNGEEIMEAADACNLEDGDSVEWKYVDFSDFSF